MTSKLYELWLSAILDLGSTIFIFNSFSRFYNYITADEDDCVHAGDTVVTILGYGDINIVVKTTEGIRKVIRLPNIAYCKGFVCNIVSLR